MRERDKVLREYDYGILGRLPDTDAMADEIVRLREALAARLAASELDAERYRFLRNRDAYSDHCLHCGQRPRLALNVGEDLDRLIDTLR